jgi:hypothetical protein
MTLRSRKLWQAGVCLLYVVVDFKIFLKYGGSEFSGGRVSRAILSLHDYGFDFLFVAIFLTVFYPRMAAAVAIAASLMIFSLYLYLIAPGPIRRFFPGEYSVRFESNFVWHRWTTLGLVILMGMMGVCLWNLLRFRPPPVR